MRIKNNMNNKYCKERIMTHHKIMTKKIIEIKNNLNCKYKKNLMEKIK